MNDIEENNAVNTVLKAANAVLKERLVTDNTVVKMLFGAIQASVQEPEKTHKSTERFRAIHNVMDQAMEKYEASLPPGGYRKVWKHAGKIRKVIERVVEFVSG